MRSRDTIQDVSVNAECQSEMAVGVGFDRDLDHILEVQATQQRPTLLFHRCLSRFLAILDLPSGATGQPPLGLGQPFARSRDVIPESL